MTTQTIDSLQTAYLDYLQAQNSSINIISPNTYWQIQAGAMAGIMLDLYYNLQLIQNSIYVQNNVGDQVDRTLYERGLPARGGQTYGYITAVITTTTPVTIPINTIFTDSTTGNSYQNLQAYVVPDNVTPYVFYATKPGNNYIEPAGNTLSGNDITIEVQLSTNGQLEESDLSCITRALASIRAPLSGSRQTDYGVYCLQYNSTIPTPVVTDSIVIPAFVVVNNVSTLGVFPLEGTAISEYQLNQGLLPATTFVGYTRAASPTTITGVNNYIQSLKLVGLTVIVGTSITNIVASTATIPAVYITINVYLVQGYKLNTLLNIPSQDINGNPIIIELTVLQLIQRETRRAICDQPYGGTNINNQNYITLNSITTVLNQQLSAMNGQLAQILTNVSISGSDIIVPNYSASTTNVYYTYDVNSYNAILVEIMDS